MHNVVLVTVKDGFEHLTDTVAATAQQPYNQRNNGCSFKSEIFSMAVTIIMHISKELQAF
jgi:hypothetical protein